MVTRNDEIIHWESHEVRAGENEDRAGGEAIRIDETGEYGSVEVMVRVAGQWTRTDFDTAAYDGERVIAVVTYSIVEDESLRFSRRVSDRPASSGS